MLRWVNPSFVLNWWSLRRFDWFHCVIHGMFTTLQLLDYQLQMMILHEDADRLCVFSTVFYCVLFAWHSSTEKTGTWFLLQMYARGLKSGMIQKFRFQMIPDEVWCETTAVAKTVELPYINSRSWRVVFFSKLKSYDAEWEIWDVCWQVSVLLSKYVCQWVWDSRLL